MRDLRPVVLVTGVLLLGLGAAMLAPMTADLQAGSPDWRAFAGAAIACGFFGGAMAISARGPVEQMSVRATFVMTTFSWVALTAFAAIPLYFANIGLTVTDAVFESISGITTTGATVITGLDTKPPGVLLWRAILQWLGGIGIVVTALAILPALSVGGMQLFRSEWFDPSGKIMPRASQIAGSLGAVYLIVTLACIACYMALDVDAFHAVCLAMTTISTGGFANSDGSFTTYAHTGADIAATVFMVIGGMPFAMLVLAMRGRVRALLEDQQLRGYLGALIVFVGGYMIYLMVNDHFSAGDALRRSAFNVVSIMTGTGFAYGDYQTWGALSIPFFFCLMFVGGCAGSTSCSIKIFRFQVAFAALGGFLAEMTQPHKLSPLQYNNRPVPANAVRSVLTFIFLFLTAYATAALLLSATGLDPTTALSGAATAIANVGPGLGDLIGPSGNFSTINAEAKWVLAAAMLVGRLEILTVFVLFTPGLWRS